MLAATPLTGASTPQVHSVPSAFQPVISLLTHGLNVHGAKLDALAQQLTQQQQQHAAERAAHTQEVASLRAELAESQKAQTTRLDELARQLELGTGELARRLGESVGERERRLSEVNARAAALEQNQSAHAAALQQGRDEAARLAAALTSAASAASATAAEVAGLREAQRGQAAAVQAELQRLAEAQRGATAALQASVDEAKRGVDGVDAAVGAEAQARREAQTRLETALATKASVEKVEAYNDERVQAEAAVEARGAAALAALADRAEGWAADAKEAAENQEALWRAEAARLDGRQAAAEEAHRRALHAHGQQAARHVKQLGRELLLEVRARVSELAAELGAGPEGIAGLRRATAGLDARTSALESRQASMANQIEMHAVATEQLAAEASSAALQAHGALKLTDRRREESDRALATHATTLRAELDATAAEAAAAAVRMAVASNADEIPAGYDGLTPSELTLRAERRPDQPALGRGTVEQRVAAAETRLEALQRTVAAAAEERARLKEELLIELARKAGIDEVEKLRASLFEHTGGLPDALRPLRDELQLGRWVWKAASHLKLAAGGKKELACMPWGAERANHWPDNFGWSKDRAHIAVAQPGLYAVSCGAFSAGAQPTLSLVVNGVVVLRRAGGTARADPSGRVAGTSLRDYVTLPADAKVAVALEVHGDGVTGVGAQGFLELRKL